MTLELFIVILFATALVVFVARPIAVRTYLRYRGKRLITGPETRKTAAVDVDNTHAAIKAVLSHPELRLRTCSRWPERGDCGQACLLQIRLSPEDCLLRNIITEWYDGKYCVFCKVQFGKLHWLDHNPALLSAEGTTVEWGQVIPEQIPEVLATHLPVCWDCHIFRTFSRKYPEMIVDRSRVSAGMHRGLFGLAPKKW